MFASKWFCRLKDPSSPQSPGWAPIFLRVAYAFPGFSCFRRVEFLSIYFLATFFYLASNSLCNFLYFSDFPCFLYTFFFFLSNFFNSAVMKGLSEEEVLIVLRGKIMFNLFSNIDSNNSTCSVGEDVASIESQSYLIIQSLNSLIPDSGSGWTVAVLYSPSYVLRRGHR